MCAGFKDPVNNLFTYIESRQWDDINTYSQTGSVY